jgi:hypothetical protein
MTASSEITDLSTGATGGPEFSFPDPVNEVSACLVAGGVVLLGLATIGFEQPWLTAVSAYGFLPRVLAGPTLSVRAASWSPG